MRFCLQLWVNRGVFADHSSTVDYRDIHLFLFELEKVQISVADWKNYGIEDFCWHSNPDYFYSGEFKLKVFFNAEFWANISSSCNWGVGSAKLKRFESEWLLEKFKLWIGDLRFCDVLKLSLKLIWAVSISRTSLFTRLDAISSFPDRVGAVNSWLVSLSNQGKGLGAFAWFPRLFFNYKKRLSWICFSEFLWWAPSTFWNWNPGSLDCCRNSDGCLGRGGIGGGWLKILLLFCFYFILRWCWIRNLTSLGAGVDCLDRFLLLQIMLTSSLMRLEDWLSWPSSSNRPNCSFSSLKQVNSVVCLFNFDDAVLWCGSCLINSSESFLSSVSCSLILLIIKENDRILFFCLTVFSWRSSSFLIDILVALNILMANWHSALFCFDILLAVAFL